MAEAPLPDLEAIRRAAARIAPDVRRTGLVASEHLSSRTGADVRLKLEIEQPTGSFKVRGAANTIRAAMDRRAVPGLATASTGNHARAVSYLGARLGVPVVAFLAGGIPDDRARALEQLGAVVDRSSPDQAAAITAAAELADERGYEFVPPFDHPDVISGQGTIGLELGADLPDLDAVLVPVSGGGLIAGIGLALKAIAPRTQIVGVCAERADAMRRSLAAGYPVPVPEVDTIATSLLGDLGTDNHYTFRAAQQVVDEIVTVSEEELARAMQRLHSEDGLVVEGAAAATTAALWAAGDRWRGRQLAALVTGNAVAQPI
ncbi:pyridoxal-phosphate dependent enzyme [Flexivirga meconopsidis]|uniref:pyridoxal-phosphate dependent enzyme n=1 Tax=Flexivirga meconopsidis TaxID=2977121 RepID=UPI00224014ED|nr:pyridoxal-phosphate dependent enzyme [Flexivirga meconopsidis]